MMKPYAVGLITLSIVGLCLGLTIRPAQENLSATEKTITESARPASEPAKVQPQSATENVPSIPKLPEISKPETETTSDSNLSAEKTAVTDQSKSTLLTSSETPTTTQVTPKVETTTKVVPTAVPEKNDTTPTTMKPTTPTTATPTEPTTKTPVTTARSFDGASFIGGIILTLGMIALGFMGMKYYKLRTERNYHTL